MSKKHPVKSTQSSARMTANTAASTMATTAAAAAARPDDRRMRPASQAAGGGASGASATGATGDTGFRATSVPSAEARARMIAEAAYYLSEQRGFAPGHEVEDWLAAEQQIDSRIESGRGVMGPMQIS